uniref:Spo11/DNA topoisomerase VI subunit A N-terminal domain-containing protein n=1 Tax=Rhodosorus marinus TaxID=101924 RepID=A0A7S2ZI91_9RHOD|mmetsp:Transcript_19400/g.77468  ORF Transcript_19400/g.77468 Transcript_19400/m.77468 type:complete len:174 (+) Transcript_19400:344-865(+)
MTEGHVADLQLVFRNRVYDMCSRGHDGSFIWGGRLVSRRWNRHGLKFCRTIKVLDALYGSLSGGRSVVIFSERLPASSLRLLSLIHGWRQVTQREVFYVLRNFFSAQAQVNEIIQDIASGLGCARSDLLVTTASTGAVAGSIHIQIANSTGQFDGWIDCEKLEACFKSVCPPQ